jgi:hypothetical protein
VLTKNGLPGWFPEDFKADPALLDAFEDAGDWHVAGSPAEHTADPGTISDQLDLADSDSGDDSL